MFFFQMSTKIDQAAYLLFETEMKTRCYFLDKKIIIEQSSVFRMKPYLTELRETEGQERFYQQIRNTVSGCQQKWKLMPKVSLLALCILCEPAFCVQEIKDRYLVQAKEMDVSRKERIDKEKPKV